MSKRTLISLFLGILFFVNAKAQSRLKNGRYHQKYDDMVVTGAVVNHQFHGTFITKQLFHFQDKLKPVWVITNIRTYANGELNGLAMSFDRNGDTTQIGYYCKGQPCGYWRRKWEGRLVSLCNYDSIGDEIGWQGYYNDAGILTRKDYYFEADEYYSWKYSEYGVLLSRGEYSTHGKEGTWYDYSGIYSEDPRDTLPTKISQWEYGKAIGMERTFVKGVILEEKQLMNGRQYGKHKLYRNGKLYVEETIYDWTIDGVQFTYCVAGTVYRKQEYKSGVSHGEYLIYDTLTNVVIDRTIFDEGVKVSREQWTAKGEFTYREELIALDSTHYRFTEYFPNGVRRSEGEFVNDLPYGRHQSWFANGQRRMSTWFRNGEWAQYLHIWNENGILVYSATVHSGIACDDELVRDDKGKILLRGTKAYSDQVQKYTPPGLFSFEENGYLFPVVTIAKPYPYSGVWSKEEPGTFSEDLCVSPTSPKYPGGEKARVDFFQKNIYYPQMELEAGIQGTTYIEFTVKADSSIADVKVLKVVSTGLSKETERVIKMMPKWIPAKKNGKAVDQKCVMGVKFEIL